MNRKWREQLTGDQQNRLQRAIGDFLADLGYPAD
jgi:hypothetical protein